MATTQARPRLFAHRGASAEATEHTLAAYDLALDLGADGLELDLRLTADDEVVVHHDRTLERLAGDPRAIADVELAELAHLPETVRPLTLDQVLRRYGDATRYLLELKEPMAPLEQLVAEAVARHRVGHLVEIMTFCSYGLRRAHRADRALSLSQLYPALAPAEKIREDLSRVARFANAIGPQSYSVDAALVNAAHARGLRVQPYTVNDPAEAERLLALGVDGLITDMPEPVRAMFDAPPVLAAVA